MAQRHLTQAQLEDALSDQSLSLSEFRAYFDRLITVAAFSRAQAAAQGLSVSAYIDQLQRAAHISFGPAVAMLDAEVRVTAAEEIGKSAVEDALVAEATPAMSGVEDATALDSLLIQTIPQQTSEATDPTTRGILPGQLAPDFSLPALNSPTGDAIAHLYTRGLNRWPGNATTCHSCSVRRAV